MTPDPLTELRAAQREVHDIISTAIAKLASFADGLEDTAPAAAARLRYYLAESPLSLHASLECAQRRLHEAAEQLTRAQTPQ